MVSRILIVEDHQDSARVAQILLQRAGYEVLIAGDCRTALQIADAENPDVVLCDIGLPDGDGCDLLSDLIKAHSLTGIAVSGYGTARDRERFRQAGFVEVVIKPYTGVQLEIAILKAKAVAAARRNAPEAVNGFQTGA